MQNSKPYFETVCHKCGFIDEAMFVFSSNGAVKQVCLHCHAYVKFFDKSLVPTHIELKQKIWYITEQNLDQINAAKKEVEFVEGLTGMAQRLQYWKLYLYIRKMAAEHA